MVFAYSATSTTFQPMVLSLANGSKSIQVQATFYYQKCQPVSLPYQLSDVKVKTMEAQKDLGDLVTKHLKWNSQVLAAYSKASSLAFSGDQLATLMTSELASYFTCH